MRSLAKRPMKSQPAKMEVASPESAHRWIKVGVTLAGGALIVLHVIKQTTTRIDGTTVGLFAICILPWLSELLTSLELPGGWKFQFRDLVRKQEEQKEILKKLTVIFQLFLTEWQLEHLRNLASDKPMPLIRDTTTFFYEQDLRKLRDLRLIRGRIGDFFRKGGDARSYLQVTELGRLFLAEASPLMSSDHPRSLAGVA